MPTPSQDLRRKGVARTRIGNKNTSRGERAPLDGDIKGGTHFFGSARLTGKNTTAAAAAEGEYQRHMRPWLNENYHVAQSRYKCEPSIGQSKKKKKLDVVGHFDTPSSFPAATH